MGMLATLRMMLFPVLNVLGTILVGFSMTLLIPLFLSFWKRDGASHGFTVAFWVTFATGAVIWLFTRNFRRELIPRDGFLLVTLAWASLACFATIPLYYEIPHITLTHAFFEATSGITTTCATVLSNIDSLPFSVNFWRCFLSWMGGIGILVMAVAVLPLLGVGGAQIFRAETSGPLKDGKLTPRIADTAKAFYLIYLALSAACAITFHFLGMDWSDAVMHTFTTVSLGGFSSHDASFGYWSSRAISYAAITFCLISGINFTMHFLAWRKMSLGVYFHDTEAKSWLFTAFFMSAIVIAILLWKGTFNNFSDAFYYGLTNTIFCISTSGFANTNYGEWPMTCQILMIIGSCFATCAGSTGSGIKMIRFIAMVKQGGLELKRILHPRMVRSVVIGGRVIPSQVIFSVLAFLLIYIAVMVLSTLFFLVSGLDGLTSFSATLACLNNIGPGLGNLGPAYSFGTLADYQIYFCCFLMLLGRLELLTVLVLFTGAFWRA